jgi:hypothetical protein
MITNHTQLLNALIEKYGLKSYLEIGVQNPANNFDKINCGFKEGVDPEHCNSLLVYQMTSDMYFNATDKIFDLIFIDGLHHADQVKRDFENSLRCLSDNGFIVIHDVLPENEEGTIVPRQTKVWWGDVYKWACCIKNYSGIRYKTFDIDNGCMLVWKDKLAESVGVQISPSWKTYTQIGRILMNVTDDITV